MLKKELEIENKAIKYNNMVLRAKYTGKEIQSKGFALSTFSLLFVTISCLFVFKHNHSAAMWSLRVSIMFWAIFVIYNVKLIMFYFKHKKLLKEKC